MHGDADLFQFGRAVIHDSAGGGGDVRGAQRLPVEEDV